MSRTEVIMPEPKSVTLNPEKSALLVLDIGQRCADPGLPCHGLASRMIPFLERVREAGILIIFTISAHEKGTPNGQVYAPLKRRPSEAVIFPDSFDKFASGELGTLLGLYGVDTLVITGYRSNIAVLYTATTAAREFNYQVVLPIDGMATLTDYEQEYTLFQFTVFRQKITKLFTFTMLDRIHFQVMIAGGKK
jgi:nicotinamidase-related amidase